MSETPDDRRASQAPNPADLVSFPIACFVGALVTDIVYAVTANMMWADFSAWLLAAGMAFAVLAASPGLSTPRQSSHTTATADLALIIGSRSSWPSRYSIIWSTAGMPGHRWSPRLAAIGWLTVLVMLVTAWLGTATLDR